MDVKKILDKLKDILNVNTYEEIAIKLGTTRANLDQWVSRKKIPAKWMIKIDKFLQNEFETPKLDLSNSFRSGVAENYTFDKLSLKASAGGGIENFKVDIVDKILISKNLFKTPLDPKTVKAIEVEGDSMEPTLKDGSFILIDTSKTQPIDGIYAIVLDGNIFVKRLEFLLDGTINIISDNTKYKTKTYTKDMDQIFFKILGKMILSVQ